MEALVTADAGSVIVLESEERLTPYVPRLLSEWALDAGDASHRSVDATLCFVDISGFTNLSEKLARKGRIGAEELTEVLDRVFGTMLRLAYARGGSLLKFGGDALLLLFQGPDHPIQAASATVEMRAALRDATKVPTSVGRISLRMSSGLHTGAVDLFRVGESHRELVITGRAATRTTEMEKTADAGEIVISPELRAALPEGSADVPKGDGWILKWRKPAVPPSGIVERRQRDLTATRAGVPVALRTHLAQGGSEPEHRVATIGFVKFKGVDALMQSGGPDRVAEELDALVQWVQTVVDREGVTFLATDIDEDGGKIILTAGVPGTQEDDEGRMLRAARRIVDGGCSLPIRIGINRGHVFAADVGTEFRRTYTVMGDTVNLAARLMAAAPPKAIYASPGVLDRSRTLFATTALEPFHVKGKSAPVQAYEVGEELGTRESRLHGELPFLGRDEELAQLRSLLDGIEAGKAGAVVTVAGETGIGKSRLAAEALAERDRGPILSIRGEAYSVANPYRALRDPLRRLLGIPGGDRARMAAGLRASVGGIAPDLLPLLPLIGGVAHIEAEETPQTASIEPRFRPDRTADAVERLLEAIFGDELVLLVEDAHWIDDASSHLLERIASSIAGRPWALLATTRSLVEGFRPPFGDVIVLSALPEEATGGIVRAATEGAPLRPHEAQVLARRSGGNPLFLEELIRVVRETGSVGHLPDSLDAVVSAEIDALPPLPRRLLRYSSVLGRTFRRDVLDALLAPEEMELDTATRRALSRFIEPDGPDRWSFRHAMMRDAAYEGLSYRKRRELHERAGGVIEEMAPAEAEKSADLLGLHFALSGRWDKAWHYSRIAGDRAKQAYANVEAATHYERALEAARRLAVDPGDVVAVWNDLGDVRELAGLYDESLQAYRAASRLASDPVDLADLLLKRARARMHAGSYRAALAEATRGYRMLDQVSTPKARITRARLMALRALLRQAQQRAIDAHELALRAIEEAEAAGDDEALARAYLIADWSHFILGEPEKAVNSRRALAIYERLGDLDGAGNVLNNLGGVSYFEGKWDEAVDCYQAAQDAYTRAGNDVSAAVAGGNIGEVLVSQRRLDEAEPILIDAIRVLRAASALDDVLFAEIQLGRLLLERGDLDTAITRLGTLREAAQELGQTGYALEAAMHLAFALVAAGSPLEAQVLLEEAAAAAGEVDPLYVPTFERSRAAALSALGRIDEARARLEESAAVARDQGLPYEEALALKAKRELAERTGAEWDPAEASRERELLEGFGVRLEDAPRTVSFPT